jgi:hypothetical protein
MMIPVAVDRHAGGGYGAERAAERPSDDELRVADLAGIGAEGAPRLSSGIRRRAAYT